VLFFRGALRVCLRSVSCVVVWGPCFGAGVSKIRKEPQNDTHEVPDENVGLLGVYVSLLLLNLGFLGVCLGIP